MFALPKSATVDFMDDTYTDHEADAEARWNKFGEVLEDEAISLVGDFIGPDAGAPGTLEGDRTDRVRRRYNVFNKARKMQDSDAPYGTRVQTMVEFIQSGTEDDDFVTRSAHWAVAGMFRPIRDITSPVSQSV